MVATVSALSHPKNVLRSAMRQAVAAASEPVAQFRQNPRVGCVLLNSADEVLAVGAHHGPGTAHAEVQAIHRAHEEHGVNATHGATAVVTLEPCKHTGLTGPCTKALLAAGISNVVFAVSDPTSQAGGGGEELREAGVTVVEGFMADEAVNADRPWVTAARRRRPWVTLKVATSLDGRIAAADSTSEWITGPVARADVHQQRGRHDAVAVGRGTVVADNCRLTVRDDADQPLDLSLQPLRVVLGDVRADRNLRVWDNTADTVGIADHDPYAVLDKLWDRGVRRLYLEGGAQVASAWVAAGAVDAIDCYIAPMLLGQGLSAVADVGVGTLSDAKKWHLEDVSLCGSDAKLRLRPLNPAKGES